MNKKYRLLYTPLGHWVKIPVGKDLYDIRYSEGKPRVDGVVVEIVTKEQLSSALKGEDKSIEDVIGHPEIKIRPGKEFAGRNGRSESLLIAMVLGTIALFWLLLMRRK